MMLDAFCRWLVRRHPAWWRRRYEAEMLSLVASSRPTASTALDLGRSCLRVWTECHGPDASIDAVARRMWLTPLRLAVQLPLALAIVGVTLAVGAIGAADLLSGGRAAPSFFWVLTVPIAASGAVAMLTALGDRSRWSTNRVTAAVVGSAVAAGLVALAMAVADDPRLRMEWRASGSPTVGLRDALLVWSAYFAAVGLIVRNAFRALPLGRCLVNCVHAERVHLERSHS
jgi:hypothetical protein